jgi:hypothetical protein
MDCCRSRVQRLIKKNKKKLLIKLLTNNQECGIINTERKRYRTMTNYYITENERYTNEEDTNEQ